MTPQRLVNADKEPQNWLMNHRTYDGQRFSPLTRINKDNVKNLKLAYAVPLGGGAGNEWVQATPLAEDGFLYITDSWGVLYKIDGTSGDTGRVVWRMDPKQQKQSRNRGATMWGNLLVTAAAHPRAHNRNRQGEWQVAWESSFADTPEVELSSAPLAINDKIIVGAAGGDQGVRDWIAGLDAKSGKRLWQKYVIPAPGELGSETWKDKNNAWQTGGGAMWVTGTYDAATNQTIWGTGNPVPMYDPTYRPGDNLYTNSAISWDPDTGKMNWYFQFTPGDMWDFDEVGTHILIDGQVARLRRARLITCIPGATASSTPWIARMARWSGRQALTQHGYQLDQRNRSEDRQARRLRSRQGHSGLFNASPIRTRASGLKHARSGHPAATTTLSFTRKSSLIPA